MNVKLVNFVGVNNLTMLHFEKNVKSRFDMLQYDPSEQYDKNSTVFVCNYYQYLNNTDTILNLADSGYKIVFENLHEADPFQLQFTHENILPMACSKNTNPTGRSVLAPMFFWYTEATAWDRTDIDYKNIQRTHTPSKKFLLLMNNKRYFRDDIHKKFSDIIDQSIYSYVGNGVKLLDDVPRDTLYWDRIVNPTWYNDTEFSVVVETQITIDEWTTFITEKSMKPFAMRHPFITIGCHDTLATLKEHGFETFDNLFDESYDTMINNQHKISHVYEQVKLAQIGEYDSLTKQKIEHNYNWFYNQTEIDKGFDRYVIDPIMEFINER